MALARGRKGARPAAEKMQARDPSRMAKRHCAALAAGRLPGQAGTPRAVEGSKGGAHGARTARRAAAAKTLGRRPGQGGAPKKTRRRPAAAILKRPAAALSLKRPAVLAPVQPRRSTSKLLLEACAYPASALSHEWAVQGSAAVRIVFRDEDTELADGPEPVPGRALDWPLDLDQRADKMKLRAYADKWKPKDLWTSPDCTTRTSLQNINKHRYQDGRPPGEEAAKKLLGFCRALHKDQRARGGRSHHEQSATSHEPFDGPGRPWAISKRYKSVKVSGCAVGLREPGGQQRLLSKEWQIESTSASLLRALEPLKCPGGHAHGQALGQAARHSASYPRAFVCIVYQALLHRAV